MSCDENYLLVFFFFKLTNFLAKLSGNCSAANSGEVQGELLSSVSA